MVLAARKTNPQVYEPETRGRVGRKRRTAPRLHPRLQLVGLTLAVFCLGMLYTYQHNRMISLGYQLEQTRLHIAALQSANKRLELTIAGLQAPGRVENIARTKLGMNLPEEYVPASLATAPDNSGKKAVRSSKHRSLFEKLLAFTAKHLVGRAEASPR